MCRLVAFNLSSPRYLGLLTFAGVSLPVFVSSRLFLFRSLRIISLDDSVAGLDVAAAPCHIGVLSFLSHITIP